MATDQPGDLARFDRFIGEQLDKQADLTPDETLVLWHETHVDDEEDDLIDAARAALEAMRAGDVGVPLEEFDREFRRRHQADFGGSR